MAKKKNKINIKSLTQAFSRANNKKEQIKKNNIAKKNELERKRKVEILEREKAEQIRLEKIKKDRYEKEQKRLKEIEQEKIKKLEDEKMESFKIKITTLSPIHIGNGEDYEAINYVIKDNYFYSFDEFLVIEELYKNKEKVPTENQLLDMYLLVEFFKSKRDFIIDKNLFITKIQIEKDIAKLYENPFGQSRNDDDSMNQMLIHQHISTINPKNGKFLPYIPGSSIKGSLQTVLNLSIEDSQKFKISDSIGINIKNQIAWTVRVKKDKEEKDKKSKISQKLEIISKGSTLEFIISKQKKITFENIKNKLNNFYQKADNQQYINYIREIKKDNQFLLRVGRYCGKNFIVKDLQDKPKTKSLFRKNEKDGKSELPFGWMLCEVIK